MFILGRDLPAWRWRERMRTERDFARLAGRLVWQADSRRFLPGGEDDPAEGPVSPAHPAELDAEEILYWRARLKECGIRQPFTQMGEPVVLRNGRLPGKARRIRSAGESYRMLDRYEGFRLPLSAVPPLSEEGFQFIVRRRWDRNEWQSAEIQVVNVVTPAGILYACRTDAQLEELSPQAGVSLILGSFYPFKGIRLRTLNHAAAALEEWLLPEMIARDARDMLLPHLPGRSEKELRDWLVLCGGDGDTARMLNRLIAQKEGSQ